MVDYPSVVPSYARKTPQRTVGIDDELWGDVHAIARARRERIAAVIRSALVRYRDENRELLNEIKASTDTDD